VGTRLQPLWASSPSPARGSPAPRPPHRPRRCHCRKRRPRRCCPCPAGRCWAHWGSCRRRPRRSRCPSSAGLCWGRAGSCPAGKGTAMPTPPRLADTKPRSGAGQGMRTFPARPVRPPQRHKPRAAAPREKHLEGTSDAPRSARPPARGHIPPARCSHLHVLDAVAVSVVVTLVPDAVVVGVLLPRIRRQAAVVLRARTAFKAGQKTRSEARPGRGVPGTPAPGCGPRSAGAHLLAVLVVVDAGQGLVRVAVEVRVCPTDVAVASPAHVALKKEEIRRWEAGKGALPAPTPPAFAVLRPPAHRTGDVTVPLEDAEAVDVAGVGGGRAAGLLRDAAGRLVPHEARLAGTALVGALGGRAGGKQRGLGEQRGPGRRAGERGARLTSVLVQMELGSQPPLFPSLHSSISAQTCDGEGRNAQPGPCPACGSAPPHPGKATLLLLRHPEHPPPITPSRESCPPPPSAPTASSTRHPIPGKPPSSSSSTHSILHPSPQHPPPITPSQESCPPPPPAPRASSTRHPIPGKLPSSSSSSTHSILHPSPRPCSAHGHPAASRRPPLTCLLALA